MGKQSAPPPPDYAAAAKEQGAANVEAAQFTAGLNRPEQHDPNGSQTWALKPGADVKNPAPGDWIVTNALNAKQQAMKDQQDDLSSQFGTLASSSLNNIGNTMQTKFDTTPYGEAQQVAGSNEASRQKVTDALYARSTAMLDPQMKQQNSDLTSRLASQGITEGSEAFRRASDNQARQQAEAYAGARNDAITAGGAEDSRIGQIDVAKTGFNNTQRQNAVTEALMLRQLPMNEANALRTGNQVGSSQFQAYGGGGQISAAPVYQAAGDGYKAQMDATSMNNANSAAMMKGVTSMGSMFMGSDRRMKKDIVRTGTHHLGIGEYDFTYIESGIRSHGVMADELIEVMPEAVMRFPDGFDRVNYALLEA